MKWKSVMGSFVAIIVVCGCGGVKDEWSDPWYNLDSVPKGLDLGGEGDKVDYWQEVPVSGFQYAEHILDNEENGFVQIEREETEEHFGKVWFTVPKDYYLYLVRAIYLQPASVFDVWFREGLLVVGYDSLGEPCCFRRTALLVALPSKLLRAFISLCRTD